MSEQDLNKWLSAWQQAALDRHPRHREETPYLWFLAAQARADPSLARRMAIIQVLSDGRPHSTSSLQSAVEKCLGEDCFGAQAGHTLEDDIVALRSWGIRIGCSDIPDVEGYYLRDPAVRIANGPGHEEPPTPLQIQIYRSMSDARKTRQMFEMFEFALQQATVGVRSRHPDWGDEQVEAQARRLVTGTELPMERR